MLEPRWLRIGFRLATNLICRKKAKRASPALAKKVTGYSSHQAQGKLARPALHTRVKAKRKQAIAWIKPP